MHQAPSLLRLELGQVGHHARDVGQPHMDGRGGLPQRQAAVASTRTHAADDDSASIDDDNIENSQTIGLAAVLEILGGRVIEEKMTEGGY